MRIYLATRREPRGENTNGTVGKENTRSRAGASNRCGKSALDPKLQLGNEGNDEVLPATSDFDIPCSKFEIHLTSGKKILDRSNQVMGMRLARSRAGTIREAVRIAYVGFDVTKKTIVASSVTSDSSITLTAS